MNECAFDSNGQKKEWIHIILSERFLLTTEVALIEAFAVGIVVGRNAGKREVVKKVIWSGETCSCL